jgi:hypothetical protein
LANFLCISPNQTKFFPYAWSQLDISATSDSVSAVSEGYQLNYRWILKLLSGPKNLSFEICVVTNLSEYPSCLCLCSICFWGNIPTAEFGMISAETTCWNTERK